MTDPTIDTDEGTEPLEDLSGLPDDVPDGDADPDTKEG